MPFGWDNLWFNRRAKPVSCALVAAKKPILCRAYLFYHMQKVIALRFHSSWCKNIMLHEVSRPQGRGDFIAARQALLPFIPTPCGSESRGPFSHVREWPPWCYGAHAAYPSALCAESNRSPEGAQKRSSPFGLPLFYFSQMTGFWRSDSTKALAFSTASARGSLTCSPVRISLQDTTPALISSSPRK